MAVDIQQDTGYIDLFIRRIVSAEEKVVPRNYQLVTTVARQLRKIEATMLGFATAKVKHAERVVDGVRENITVSATRQVFLKPNIYYYVLVTTKSSGLLTIKPRILRSSLHCTPAAQCVMDVLLGRLFHILVMNFSNREVHLQNNKKIVNTEKKSIVRLAVDTVDPNTATIESPKADDNSISSDLCAPSNVKLDHRDKSVYYVPYRTESRTRKFRNIKIDKVLAQEDTNPAKTEWITLMVFATKKDSTLRVFVY